MSDDSLRAEGRGRGRGDRGRALHLLRGAPPARRSTFAYKPGQFLTAGGAERPDRGGGPLLLAVEQPGRRGAADDHGQAHGRGLRLQLDRATTCARATASRVLPPSGIFTPASLSADLLLFAGGSGITPVISITRTALAAGHRPDRAVLRQPRREVGDLRPGADPAGGRAPGPAAGRALAGVGAGPAQPGADAAFASAPMRRTTPSCAARRRS